MLPHGTCDSHTCKPTCKSNFSRKSSDSYQWKFHVSMCGVFCSDHLQFCSGKYVSVTCCLGSAMCDCFHGFAEAGLRAASAQMPKLEESSPVRFSAWCSRQLCFFFGQSCPFCPRQGADAPLPRSDPKGVARCGQPGRSAGPAIACGKTALVSHIIHDHVASA